MSLHSESFKRTRKRPRNESEKTLPYDLKIQEGEMIAHLLKAVQKKRFVEHEDETALFQKLVIHWIGERRLELWVAWEDGEIDFIFPEYPELLFEENLLKIWHNWEDYSDPLETWMEQFLLVYSEATRSNAVLSTWQEKSLEDLDSQRNKKYDVAGNTLIVVANALMDDLAKNRFPTLSVSLQIALSSNRYLPKETKVKVTCDETKVGELEKLWITEERLTSIASAHLTKRNSGTLTSIPDISIETVYTMFENLVIGRIQRNYDWKRLMAELHVALISQFGFQTLGEILDTCGRYQRERKRTWHFVLNLKLTDCGELVIPWNVKIGYASSEEKLSVTVTTMKTIADKSVNKNRVFEVSQKDKGSGFHDLAERVRVWIRGVATNNNALKDIIEYLYNGVPE